ncbi:MAG: hypothetical protein AAFR91_08070 [Pseudomonadota bacterium]
MHTTTELNHPNGAERLTESSAETSTVGKAATRAHELIDKAADRLAHVEQQLRDKADQTGESLERKQQAATERFDEALRQAEGFVREKPLTAAAVAFAAGILTTKLFRS